MAKKKSFIMDRSGGNPTNSKRKALQISRYLRAALWKSAHIWLRKIEGKAMP